MQQPQKKKQKLGRPALPKHAIPLNIKAAMKQWAEKFVIFATADEMEDAKIILWDHPSKSADLNLDSLFVCSTSKL